MRDNVDEAGRGKRRCVMDNDLVAVTSIWLAAAGYARPSDTLLGSDLGGAWPPGIGTILIAELAGLIGASFNCRLPPQRGQLSYMSIEPA